VTLPWQMHWEYRISQIELYQQPRLVAGIALTWSAFPSERRLPHSLRRSIRRWFVRWFLYPVSVTAVTREWNYRSIFGCTWRGQDRIALGKLLLVSGLSPEFLSVFDENTIDGIIQSFVAMSDWPQIEQNITVDLAVDVREQAKKVKAPTLSIAGKYDQIVPPSYTQDLADLILTAKRAEIPSGHLSFLEKPADLASAMLTFLLGKHP
jgi:pimeloyl-ACP methyl ester carboxylesterase